MPRFQTKPIEVEAVELRCSYTFGRAKGRAGDWLVTHGDGRQEIVGAEAFTAGFELIAGNGAPPAPAPSKPAKWVKDRPTVPKKQARTGRTPEQLEQMCAAYERGDLAEDVAKLGDTSVANVYYYAKAKGWKRRADARAEAKAKTAMPKGEQLRGRVRCVECGSMTEYDPCEHCGKPVRFK